MDLPGLLPLADGFSITFTTSFGRYELFHQRKAAGEEEFSPRPSDTASHFSSLVLFGPARAAMAETALIPNAVETPPTSEVHLLIEDVIAHLHQLPELTADPLLARIDTQSLRYRMEYVEPSSPSSVTCQVYCPLGGVVEVRASEDAPALPRAPFLGSSSVGREPSIAPDQKPSVSGASPELQRPAEFRVLYDTLASDLGRLLNTKFDDGAGSMASPVGRALVEILHSHSLNRMEERNQELARLSLLAKQLTDVSADTLLLRDFQKRFRRASQSDEFYAVRFELNIAATLCRRGIKFRRGESPDFQLDHLAIECTSTRLRGSHESDDYMYKFRSAINQKCKKPYATPRTCLAIDATNVLHRQQRLDAAAVRALVGSVVRADSFGSILIFCVLHNRSVLRIESNYIRTDLPWIDPELRALLDGIFPFGLQQRYNIAVPFEA